MVAASARLKRLFLPGGGRYIKFSRGSPSRAGTTPLSICAIRLFSFSILSSCRLVGDGNLGPHLTMLLKIERVGSKVVKS